MDNCYIILNYLLLNSIYFSYFFNDFNFFNRSHMLKKPLKNQN